MQSDAYTSSTILGASYVGERPDATLVASSNKREGPAFQNDTPADDDKKGFNYLFLVLIVLAVGIVTAMYAIKKSRRKTSNDNCEEVEEDEEGVEVDVNGDLSGDLAMKEYDSDANERERVVLQEVGDTYVQAETAGEDDHVHKGGGPMAANDSLVHTQKNTLRTSASADNDDDDDKNHTSKSTISYTLTLPRAASSSSSNSSLTDFSYTRELRTRSNLTIDTEEATTESSPSVKGDHSREDENEDDNGVEVDIYDQPVV